MKSQLFRRRNRRGIVRVGLFSLGLAGLIGSAQATDLVVNGNFEDLLVPGAPSEVGSHFPSQQLMGWTSTGYNFVFAAGRADTIGSNGEYGSIYLWGPNNGSNNSLPATSPAGGNFVAMDGAFEQGPISQNINGLTPGVATTVSFYWAGAQQRGYNSATTDQFQVSLGSEIQFTPVLDNASHGFTGWHQEVLTFMPTSSSEVLSFLAIGMPGGVPPFALLDGVSVSAAAPEPAAWALFMGGLGAVGCFGYLRRRAARTKTVRS
jgi:hypothetical protein